MSRVHHLPPSAAATRGEGPAQQMEALVAAAGTGNGERLRELIDALPAAIYTTDAQGRLTYFNQACVAFSGRQPQLGNDRWCVSWKLYHPDGRPMPHDQCPMAIALTEGREIRGAEAIAERPDGSRIWFTPYPQPLRDAAGRVVGGVNMLVDISERKAAEAALQASQRKFATAFSQSPLGITITSLKTGKLVDVNQSLLDVTGYTRDEVLGRSPDEVGMWLDPAQRQARFEMFRRGQRPPDIEAQFRVKDGSMRTALVASNLIDVDGEPCVLTSVVDVTERKRAEQAAALLGAIVNNSDDAIISKNLDGIITSWNPGAERLFGHTAAEAVGRSVASLLIPAEAQAEESMLLDRLRRGERIEHFETLRRRKDGTLIPVSLTVSPIKDENGRIVGASKIARDISERRRAEAALRQAAETGRRLYQLSVSLHPAPTPEAVLEALLDPAIELMGAARGMVQIADQGALRLVATRGFDDEFQRQFARVTLADDSVCGRALRRGGPVLVADVEEDAAFAPFRELARRKGFRAVLSTPLMRGKDIVAMLSVHFARPHHPGEPELRLLDVYMRLAAEVFERKQAEQALAASEARQRFLAELGVATQALSHPERIAAVTAQLFGRHLGAQRCFYAEIEGDEAAIAADYADAVPSLAGRHPLASFGEDVLRRLRDNRTFVAGDIESQLPGALAGPFFRAARARAAVIVPLHKSGAFVACLAVLRPAPNRWSHDEIELIERVVHRCWESVERARALRALADSESRARLALDVAGQGTWSWDPNRDVVEADARCREICGLKPRGPLRQSDVVVRVHPDDLPRVNQAIWASVDPAGDGSYAEEFRFMHSDGSERWVVSRGQARFVGGNGDRRAELVMGTVLDITERKRAEAELRDTDRRKDEFLATLAHELRNPLAPLRNSLHILRMSHGNEPLHEMMERQVNHMVRLVDDLLEVSRISRGKIEIKRERLRLSALLYDVLETARPQIAAAGHELTVTLPKEPLLLDADPVRLAQVFGNLLHNAAKYTPGGGRIWLTAMRDEQHAVVSVRDNGVGIPPEMLTRVFEVFTQVERDLSRSQGGLGIGLALVRNLLRLHGGRIEARSEGRGKGAEFIVRLPLAAERRAAVRPEPDTPEPGAADAAAPHRAPRRVLVVDDNRDAADSLGMLLRFLGAEVQVVHSGAAALATMQAYRPAAVLLDLGMPGMDGFEVARRVRERFGADITLIALTGWGQEEDRRRTREAGFDHHLIKPPELAALQAILASLEERGGAER